MFVCFFRYERLAKILIGVKAGIDHLTEKLSSLKATEPNPSLGALTSTVVRDPLASPAPTCHPTATMLKHRGTWNMDVGVAVGC